MSGGVTDDFDAIQSAPGAAVPAQASHTADFDEIKTQDKSKPSYSGALGTDSENFWAGVGKGATDVALGAKQLIDIPANYLDKKFPGISKWASDVTGMPTTQEAIQSTKDAVAESKQFGQTLNDTKAGFAGNVTGQIVGNLTPLGIISKTGKVGAVANTARSLLNPTTYKAAAAAGALSGALQPVTDDESRAVNMGTGALFGIGGNAVANTLGRVAQPVVNVLSSAHQKAVQVLENAGITLDAAQKTGSSVLNKIRSSFSDNPFTSGTQAEMAAQQRAGYNRAVLKTIGEDATAATPEVMDRAASRINGVFTDVLNRNNVAMTDPVVSKIASIQAAATEEEKAPVASIANRIMSAVGEDGKIPGQVAYNIKKDLDRISSSPDTTLAYHARQLRSTLMDAINDSLPEADQKAFAEARNQFGNMKKIEPTIDRMGNGDISAPKLANVMAQKANRQASIYGRGDQELVDLAHSGNLLLPDKTGNSGTTARAAMQLAVPLVVGGTQGSITGDWEGAAKTAAGMYAIPKAAQYLINNPTTAKYLSSGMQGSMTPLRNILESPTSNTVIGAPIKRLPSIMYNSQSKNKN